ncbi:MAG TPA: sensor histidine kinase [Chitinophagaceae bacterium]
MASKTFSPETILKHRVLLHVLFWLVVLVYFTFGYGKPGEYGIEALRSLGFLPHHIIMVYVFFYFLIPKYLLKKKFLPFAIGGILVTLFGIGFSYIINFKILPVLGFGDKLMTVWNPGLAVLGQFTLVGSAVSIKLLKYWYQQKQETMEMQQQKLSAELQLLKSQVHPHFLFNTLNNLYSFTLHQSHKAPEIVLKLSQLLRFMIYESKAPLIPLSSEIGILQDYIELEKLRYGNGLDISLSFTGDIQRKVIPPLLLLPLIENSFKHGTSNQLEQSWISLDLHVDKNVMNLKLVNSRDNENTSGNEEHKGVGLQNVQRRLELLYPGKHNFQVKQEDEIFIVQLQLELEEEQTSAEPSINYQPVTYDMEMLAGR